MAKQKACVIVPFDESKIRKTLRKNVPQINKLENFAGLKNLKVIMVDDKKEIVTIFYEGIASQELYPNVSKKLIERKVIREDNLINSWMGDKGKYNECMNVHVGLDFPGYDVSVLLRIYKPNYKKPQSQNFKN